MNPGDRGDRGSAIALVVNGTKHEVAMPGGSSLLSALRDELKLKGTRIGCEEERCGACTVLVEGAPVHSCRTPVELVAEKAVTTIEGLAGESVGADLVHLFLEEQAAQCGYCTNGLIVGIAGLLRRDPAPTRAEVLSFLDERHLCRCGAHPRILKVIDRVLARSETR